MNSERFEVQQVIEGALNCASPENLKQFKSEFENLTVSSSLQSALEGAAENDARGLYFKAILSIAEAINAISQGRHSWSVVKMYYATFYLTRCIFAARSIAVVKCAGIYTIKIEDGSKPIKRDKGKFRNQTIRGDHITTFATYISDIGASDKILSNKISELTVFEWLMKRREEVHYRAPTFHEPEFRTFEQTIHSQDKLKFWVNEYLDDDNLIYCFQENHCGLAAPLKFAQQAQEELLEKYGRKSLMTTERITTINSILKGTQIDGMLKFKSLLT